MVKKYGKRQTTSQLAFLRDSTDPFVLVMLEKLS